MDITTLIGVASLAVLGAVAALLALWCDYHDGVFGHLALGVIALCALAVSVDALNGVDYTLLPTTAWTFAAMAVFMLRHAWRAIRYRRGKGAP